MAGSACGEAPAIPELTATPLPVEATEEAATPDAPRALASDRPSDAPSEPSSAPSSEPPADQETAAAADTGGTAATAGLSAHEEPAPTHDAQRAAYLYDYVADARESDHLITDLVGDHVAELVTAKITVAHDFEVALAVWDGQDFVHRAAVVQGRPQRLGTPVARDLTGDGRLEILAPSTDGNGPAVLAVAVADDGRLTVPAHCPVSAPSHQSLRLRSSRATTEVVLSCDAQVEPTEAVVLRWRDGRFVTVRDGAADDVVAPDRDEDEPERDDGRATPPGHAADGGRGRGDDPPGHDADGDRGRGDDPPGRGHGRGGGR